MSQSFSQGAFKGLLSLLLPSMDVVDHPFAPADVARLHARLADPDAPATDDATWNDLLLAPYLASLSPEVSIFGQQLLHHRLRAGLDPAARAALGERVREQMRDPARMQQMQRDCEPLRAAETEVAALIFGDEPAPRAPAWAGLGWLLLIGLLASLAAAILWSPWAYLGAGLALFLLMSTQVIYGARVDAWKRSMVSVQMLLRTCSVLGEGKDPMLEDFAAHAHACGKLNRDLSRSLATKMAPAAEGYADWFMLANVEHYFKGVALVHARRDFLRACFMRCAQFEADLALARHLLQAPSFCWAVQGGAAELALEHAVHPLLAQAQPLTLGLRDQGAFISGQNGIGKSTLLRTIGLNLVAARAFGFCYATSARVPQLPVYASMQSEDSLFGGESLYLAELRRARELMAAADAAHGGAYIIDEIFRGTNHLESVSAAAAVLDALAATGMVIVSSHNLVLAPLLAHRLAPWCVAAGADGQLTLAPGLLTHTNGIALLAERGFGPRLEANAGRVFDWLGAHLAQPADCAGVLGPVPM